MNREKRLLPIFLCDPIENEFTEISIVNNPAIQEDFLTFSEEEEEKFYNFNEEQMVIKGPVLIPNKLIYRSNPDRYIKFDEKGIKKSVEIFSANGFKFNKEHTRNEAKVNIIESYFADEKNEFNVPKGSWIVSAKVNDTELWDEIKINKFNGFSFQGKFGQQFVSEEYFSKENKENNMNKKDKMINFLNELFFSEDEKVVEVVEEVKTEEVIVDKVEEVVEEVKTEEVIVELAVDPNVDPSLPTETSGTTITKEEVQTMLDDFALLIETKIEEKIAEKLAEINGTVVEMSSQIEKFGKTPMTKPLTEVVNLTPADSKYGYLVGLKK